MQNYKLTLFRLGLTNAMLVSIYHFYLPYHFDWQLGLTETPEMLVWTLMTLNNGWSLLCLLFAGLLYYFSLNSSGDTATKRLICGGFAFYWICHTLNLILNGPIFPQSLAWIGQLFLGGSIFTTAFLLLGLGVFKHSPQKLGSNELS